MISTRAYERRLTPLHWTNVTPHEIAEARGRRPKVQYPRVLVALSVISHPPRTDLVLREEGLHVS
jgi:hypothetical protein